MNVEELSMIGPDIDLETVDAINKKRLLAFINHFVINTSLFLNKLSKSCEKGLMKLENKIQKLETSVIILESKLNSVPDLEVKENALVPDLEPVKDKENVVESKDNGSNEEEKKDSQEALDPSYLKYIKLIQVGVPLAAVKLKMQQEGVDPFMHDAVLNFNK